MVTVDVRDQVLTAFRQAVCQRMGVVPFVHQASVWAATDGLILSETATTPGHGIEVQLPDRTTEWRVALPRGGGRARVVSDLGSFKIGKALSIHTPIPTPAGYVLMGDLRVGDTVFDEHGRPCRVIGATPPHIDPDGTYLVTFDDGETLVASANHEWWTYSVRDRRTFLRQTRAWREARRTARGTTAKNGTGYRHSAAVMEAYAPEPITGAIHTTAEIARSVTVYASQQRGHAIPSAGPWDSPAVDLPIDPYVLGAWLGDGTGNTGVITSADPEVLYEITAAGYTVAKVPSASYGWRVEGLTTALRQAGVLSAKHVPAVYLTASPAQRLALLQGLMDTDGSCTTAGLCEFMNTDRGLAGAVWQLAVSLGIKARWAEKRATLDGKDCGPAYRVYWTHTTPVFRLPRKLARLKPSVKLNQRLRYIVSCELVSDQTVRCIEVDSPSHLFLAGRAGIPTHNSFGAAMWATGFAAIPDRRVKIVGIEYDTCAPEFEYLVEFLLSERGMSLKYASLQNRPKDGRMWLELQNGTRYEARSWDRKDGLKGKEDDAYIFAEAYQLPGLECYTDFKQNLDKRQGYAYFATTPDRPWVKVFHKRGHGDALFPNWQCVCGIARDVNPYAFNATAKEQDRLLMTREKFAIHYEGQLGEFVGSVFGYQRGQRQFTTRTHPWLWADPTQEPTLENLQIPTHWQVLGAGDTGTFTSAVLVAFDEAGEAYVLYEQPNYRYVAGKHEWLDVSIPEWAGQMRAVMGRFGVRGLWADKNSQFKRELQNYDLTLFGADEGLEKRTEITREYFQHGKVWMAPWLSVLPYELEQAQWPEEATAAGKFARVKKQDHTLDGLEHVLAKRPRSETAPQRQPKRWIDDYLGRPAPRVGGNVHLGAQ